MNYVPGQPSPSSILQLLRLKVVWLDSQCLHVPILFCQIHMTMWQMWKGVHKLVCCWNKKSLLLFCFVANHLNNIQSFDWWINRLWTECMINLLIWITIKYTLSYMPMVWHLLSKHKASGRWKHNKNLSVCDFIFFTSSFNVMWTRPHIMRMW